jgi:hypothetical protein
MGVSRNYSGANGMLSGTVHLLPRALAMVGYAWPLLLLPTAYILALVHMGSVFWRMAGWV